MREKIITVAVDRRYKFLKGDLVTLSLSSGKARKIHKLKFGNLIGKVERTNIDGEKRLVEVCIHMEDKI